MFKYPLIPLQDAPQAKGKHLIDIYTKRFFKVASGRTIKNSDGTIKKAIFREENAANFISGSEDLVRGEHCSSACWLINPQDKVLWNYGDSCLAVEFRCFLFDNCLDPKPDRPIPQSYAMIRFGKLRSIVLIDDLLPVGAKVESKPPVMDSTDPDVIKDVAKWLRVIIGLGDPEAYLELKSVIGVVPLMFRMASTRHLSDEEKEKLKEIVIAANEIETKQEAVA